MASGHSNVTEKDRVAMGQSIAKGDTGDGKTGVRPNEQGMSNRPGDRAPASDGEEIPELEDDDDAAADDGDEPFIDPEAEPGKPV